MIAPSFENTTLNGNGSSGVSTIAALVVDISAPKVPRIFHVMLAERAEEALIVLEVLQPARAALLGRIGGDCFDLRLLGLSSFLVRPLLAFRHHVSP